MIEALIVGAEALEQIQASEDVAVLSTEARDNQNHYVVLEFKSPSDLYYLGCEIGAGLMMV